MPSASVTENRLGLWIAARYLFARASRLSSVGRLALAGLILSVAVLVVVISVVNGFERELRQRVLGLLPHITVGMAAGAPTGSQLVGIQPDQAAGIESWAPFVSGTVLLSKDDALISATATGVAPENYPLISNVNQFAATGGLQLLAPDEFSVMLGAGLAQKLGVTVGDSVRLILPVGGVSAVGVIPRQRNMRVVDIFTSESLLDSQLVYLHIHIAQRLFRGRGTGGLHVRVTELFDLSAATSALYATLGEDIRIRTWVQKYGPLYQAIAVQRLTMFVLMSFLVGVAAFNLISGLIMIVEQRKQDVAVLSTLGLGRSGVLRLFLILGGAISVSGILAGLLVGVLLASGLPLLFEAVSSALGIALMNQYFIAYLPVDIRLADLVVIGCAALLFALVATIFPAYRATHILPGKVLAHE